MSASTTRSKRKENGVKNCNASENQTTRRILSIACGTALAVALAFSQPAPADNARPPVPADFPVEIQVLPPNTVFFVGHGVGTQNYVCLPSGDGFKFKLFTPQATLFNGLDREVTTHYFSPNPSENGTIRATWQHSRDTSTVWGKITGNAPVQGAIDLLRVEITGRQDGPTGGDMLAHTTFIQRLNTSGGVAPSSGCSSLANVGTTAFVPYSADYAFYTVDQ
jgi:hypothetical protein